MIRKVVKWFQKCIEKTPHRAQRVYRLLRIDPLEKRNLLAVTLGVKVYVENIAQAGPAAAHPGPGNVPVIGANVTITYTATSGSDQGQSVTVHKYTNSTGTATFSLANFDPPAPNGTANYLSSIDVSTNYDATILNRLADYPDVNFELDKFDASGAHGPYNVHLGAQPVTQATDTIDVPIDAHATGDLQTARAFTIYSALSVPLEFAKEIGAKLPDKFYVNYPNNYLVTAGSTEPTSFYYNDPSVRLPARMPPLKWPSLNFRTNTLDVLDHITHEFGHMVAWTNGFANRKVGATHYLLASMRCTLPADDNTAINPSYATATQKDLEEANNEGYADYYAVAAKISQPVASYTLNLPELAPTASGKPNTEYDVDDIATKRGSGEDNELSVASFLYTIAQVGINADGRNPNQATLAPCGAKALFDFLSKPDSPCTDFARFYADLQMNPIGAYSGSENEYFAALGALAQSVGISTPPGTLATDASGTFGPAGNMVFTFSVPRVVAAPGGASEPINTTTFQQDAIWVQVFNSDWQLVCTCATAAGQASWLPTTKTCPITIDATTAPAQPATGTLDLTSAAWQTIVNGHGYFWVVESHTFDPGAYSPDLAPLHYWSAPAVIDVSTGVLTTSFKRNSDPAFPNDLVLTYNILPGADGWPANHGEVVVGGFTVSLYLIPDDSLEGDWSNLPAVATYPVPPQRYLKATDVDNRRNLPLGAGLIDATLFNFLTAIDFHLVAEIDFQGSPAPKPARLRFQCGQFQLSDNSIWIFGGQSLADDTSENASFGNDVTIASADGGLTVSESISGGGSTDTYSGTFSTPGKVTAFVYDGKSTIDGSGVTDTSASLYAYGGNGDDSFTGCSGWNTFSVGDGIDKLLAGAGLYNTFTAGSGNDLLVAGPGQNSLTFGNGNCTVLLGDNSDENQGENSVHPGTGRNLIVADGASPTAWAIFPAAGADTNNQLVFIDAAGMTVATGSTVEFDFPSNGFVRYYSTTIAEPQTLDTSFATNTLTLGAGFTLYAQALDDVSSQTDVVVDGGNIDLGGQISDVNSLTINSGSVYDGTLYSAQGITAYGGSITATLSGGNLTKLGDDTLDLSGADNSLFQSDIVVHAGFIAADSAACLGSGALIGDGGGLTWTGQFDIPATKEIDVREGGVIFNNGGFDPTIRAIVGYAGAGGDEGGITLVGAGITTLAPQNGDNIYQGEAEIASGAARFNAGAVPAGTQILVDSGAALVAAGEYATAADWLTSQIIDTNSSGALALVADEPTIVMTGYPAIFLGAAVDNVTLTGSITPDSFTYNLGGGPYPLTVNTVLANYDSTATTVVINGNVVLGAANTYAGGTTINYGTLSISADSALGNGGAVTFGPAGTLQALAGFSTARDVNTPSDATAAAIVDAYGNIVALTGTITGTGLFFATDTSANGGGAVLLEGTNDYLGGTLIGAVTLGVNSDDALGNTAGTITFFAAGTLQALAGFTTARDVYTPDNPTLAATLDAGGNDIELTGTIAGNAELAAIDSAGGGMVTLTGQNSFAGGTTIATTLAINADAALGDTSGPVTFVDGGALRALQGITFDTARGFIMPQDGSGAFNPNGNVVVVPGPVIGLGGLILNDTAGGGVLMLSGSNDWLGTTTVVSATLMLDGPDSITTGTTLVVGDASAFDGGGRQTMRQPEGFQPQPQAPVLTAIQYQGPAVVETSQTQTVSYVVSFSAAVANVTVSDFCLDATGGVDARITGFSGNGFRYVLTVALVDQGSGGLSLQMTTGGAIVDANDLPLSTANLPLASRVVLVNPLLSWSGSGSSTSNLWRLPNGATSGFIAGSPIQLAAGSDLTIPAGTTMAVRSLIVLGSAMIEGGGTLALAQGGVVNILSGVAAFGANLTGSGLTKLGAGALITTASASFTGVCTVAAGLFEPLLPLTGTVLASGGQEPSAGDILANPAAYTGVASAPIALAEDLAAEHGGLTRSDMIAVLESAAADGGVSDAELASLYALTSPAAAHALTIHEYVSQLSADVVQGSQANATYQGQAVGNLATQTSDQARALALTDFIEKWFLGNDLPAIPCGTSYSNIGNPLYGSTGGPTADDARQGALGDCWLLAAMKSVAGTMPVALANDFIDNGDGTFTLRFFYRKNGVFAADYVTVNRFLPVFSNGGLAFAQAGPDGALWMALLEKGLAQWNQTGHEGRDGTNSYPSLSGGWPDAADQWILGYSVTNYSSSGPATKAALIAALQNGAAVTVGIFDNGDPRFSMLCLVNAHAYTVVSYNAAADSFQLLNPWGCYDPLPLTWADLKEFAPCITVAAAGCATSADSPPAGMSAAEVHDAALLAVLGLWMPHAALMTDIASFASWSDSALGSNARALAHDAFYARSAR